VRILPRHLDTECNMFTYAGVVNAKRQHVVAFSTFEEYSNEYSDSRSYHQAALSLSAPSLTSLSFRVHYHLIAFATEGNRFVKESSWPRRKLHLRVVDSSSANSASRAQGDENCAQAEKIPRASQSYRSGWSSRRQRPARAFLPGPVAKHRSASWPTGGKRNSPTRKIRTPPAKIGQ